MSLILIYYIILIKYNLICISFCNFGEFKNNMRYEQKQYPEYGFPLYHYVTLYLTKEEFSKLPKKLIKDYYNGKVPRITNLLELDEINPILDEETKHLFFTGFSNGLPCIEIEREVNE